MGIKLDASLVYGFQQAYLAPKFDNPAQTAPFHIEMWSRACSDAHQVVHAAPRGHAKSTSQTHTLTLAFVLFRLRDFGVIVSDTEAQAVSFLRDISVELNENEDLKAAFGIKGFIKDAEAEIEVEFNDGEQFKLIAKGSEQKVRGLKWRNKRPNFIMIDDVENDESVMNPERREKLKNWIFKALLPCGSKDCIVRVVGTVLHFDSFLENILNDDEWVSHRYSAHAGYDDFSNILWPEQFDESYFRRKRQNYINRGMPEGYSQEYLNQPLSSENSFFRKEWLKPFTASDYDARKTYYAGVDFAISQKQRRDRTAIVVVGVNTYGVVFVEHVTKGQWDAKEIIDQMFEVAEMFEIDTFYAESGAISKAIGPFLNDEMIKRNVFLDITSIIPTKDKESRAKPIQGRARASGIKFDHHADWWPELEMEMLQFPRGAHDDQVDALSLVGLNLDKIISPLSAEEEIEEEWALLERESQGQHGRNQTTGY